MAGLGTLPLGAFGLRDFGAFWLWGFDALCLRGFGDFFMGGVLYLSFLMQVENADILQVLDLQSVVILGRSRPACQTAGGEQKGSDNS